MIWRTIETFMMYLSKELTTEDIVFSKWLGLEPVTRNPKVCAEFTQIYFDDVAGGLYYHKVYDKRITPQVKTKIRKKFFVSTKI